MNKCMRFGVRLLESLGIFENGSKRGFEWLKMFIFMSIMSTLFLSGVVELTHSTNDFNHFNDILSTVSLGAMGLAKYATLIYYRGKITNLRDEIDGDNINGDKSNYDVAVVERYDRAGLSFSKTVAFVVTCVGVGISIQNLPDLFRDERRLPIDIVNIFSSNSTAFFAIVYAQQLISLTVFVLTFVATNAWAIFLAYHACGHFCLLQNYLERIAEDADCGGYHPMDTSRRIAKCVKLHQNVLRMTKDLEEFFTIPNFVHFLVSAVGICASAYGLSAGNVEPEELVKHVSVILGQFAQLFIVNWCGQLIQDEAGNMSFGVSLAIYRSNFYKLKTCHQRDIALVLLRAQKPMYLTAGKFYNLSLESMTNILRGSVSCFAMFANVDKQLEIT